MPSRMQHVVLTDHHTQWLGHVPTVLPSVRSPPSRRRRSGAGELFLGHESDGAQRRAAASLAPSESDEITTTRGRQGRRGELLRERETVAVGQADVDEHRLGPQLGRPATASAHVPASPTTTSPHDRSVLAASVAEGGVVVDDEYGAGHRRHRRSALGRRG